MPQVRGGSARQDRGSGHFSGSGTSQTRGAAGAASALAARGALLDGVNIVRESRLATLWSLRGRVAIDRGARVRSGTESVHDITTQGSAHRQPIEHARRV